MCGSSAFPSASGCVSGLARVWHQGLLLPLVQDSGLCRAWCDPSERPLSWPPFLLFISDTVQNHAEVLDLNNFDRWLAFIGGKPSSWSSALAQLPHSRKQMTARFARVQTLLLTGAQTLWSTRASLIRRKLADQLKALKNS